MTRAVFVDRDGTLIEEAGYLDRLERMVFFPFSVDAVRVLNRAGFKVVVITNQAGIARGIVRESFVAEAHRHISQHLEAGGAKIDAFYYCPHYPDGVLEQYRRDCDCRKPQPGLLRRAGKEMTLDLARSFVVGDRWHDLAAGHAVGARAVLVRTGLGRKDEIDPHPGTVPDTIVDNLMDAAAWILQQA
jgi:D-glycero-D-manno-heptose 1,7-bisphosphate phosphatase